MPAAPASRAPKQEFVPVVNREDPRLLNNGELATSLGVSRAFVRRMRSHGFKMPLGRATVDMALRFIEENKDVLHEDGSADDAEDDG